MLRHKEIVAIIGSGNIGSAIAELTANAGYDVVLSNSRGPDTLRDMALQIGPRARAAPVPDAIEAGDIIIVSIPFGKFATLLPRPFQGKLVIDATNYIPGRDSNVANLLSNGRLSAEVLQEHLSGATVVKAFNNIYSGHLKALSREPGAPDRSALPIAADDRQAKQRVTAFLNDIGWDAVDAGPLARSVQFSVETPSFVKAYMADQSGPAEEWGSRITSDPGKPLPAEQLARLLDRV